MVLEVLVWLTLPLYFFAYFYDNQKKTKSSELTICFIRT